MPRLLSTAQLPNRIRQGLETWRAVRQIRREGLRAPLPQFLKAAILRREAVDFGAETFIETGTFLGDTTAALADVFRSLYTIEVHAGLFEQARRRFSSHSHIHPVLGDSATKLVEVLGKIPRNSPTLLWLDGHYSGVMTGRGASECPIVEELKRISDSQIDRLSIVIDDIRLFGTDPAYPTMDEFQQLVQALFPGATLRVENDMAFLRSINRPSVARGV